MTTTNNTSWRPVAEEFKRRAIEVLGPDEDDQFLDLEELAAYVDHLCGDEDDGLWEMFKNHEAEGFAFNLMELIHYARTIRLLCDEDDEDARRRIIETSIEESKQRMMDNLDRLRARANKTRDELNARREARGR